MTSVVLVDDQVSYVEAFESALSRLSDLHVVGVATTAHQGTALCLDLKPDVAVVDYRLPGRVTGTDVVAGLRKAGFDAPIGVLTGFHAPRVQREAAGFDNVYTFSKDCSLQQIIAWVEAMVAGTAQMPKPTIAGLTTRELEVLERLNQGSNATEIATQLNLSLHTVRDRIKSIHNKLMVTSQREAIIEATRRGLLVPPA